VPELVMYEEGVERTEFTRRVVTRELMLESESQATADQVAKSAGLVFRDAPAYAPGKFLYLSDSSPEALAAWNQIEEQKIVSSSLLLARQQSKRAMPNDSLINQQWHLKFNNQTGAVVGTDVNIDSAWGYSTAGGFRGKGVRVGVVDDGLQTAHPDLTANVDTTNDKDWNGDDNNPNPGSTDNHGTACAGNVAACGNNNLGVSGTAPEATLVGMRLIGGVATDTMEAEVMNYLPQVIQIKSNSWGPNDDGVTLEGPGPLTLAALKSAIETGRNGKGTIFTWAGGNGGSATTLVDNSNYDGYANSIYTIAVAAFDSQSKRSYYSEPGANLVVTAPSSGASPALGITTVDRTGSSGYNTVSSASGGDYTSDFGGTSSATPTVSGIVALMLEANPNLGWRDVQEVLMRSAKKVNPSDVDWKTPIAPDNINHNHNFGSGLIDATTAVNLAKIWVNLSAQKSLVTTQASLSIPIPDNSASGATRSFDFSASNLRVEHVTVKLSIGTVPKGQLEVSLVSPSGTVSRLSEKHSDTKNIYSGWTFMTVRSWGENSRGTWTLKVADRTSGTVGTLTAAEVTIYGTDAVPTNSPPSVTLIQPASGSYLASGASVTLAAAASDFAADGSTGLVSSVQFFQGATPLGIATLNSGFYAYTWSNPPAGSYSITARATDSEGAVGVSAPVLFTVLSGNGSPVISSFSTTSASVGSSVVLTGSNFVNVSGVAFSGTPAASFTVNSATQITAVVPNGAVSGSVTVTNGFGSGASSSALAVTVLPVVISQIYGGAGSTGAIFNQDYIELYNRSASTQSLAGWSVQYAGATGTTWASTLLSGSIGAGKYYLVALGGGTSGSALPNPDVTGTMAISATVGKVALVNFATALSGVNPSGTTSGLQDFVGYGSTANGYEGSGPTPAPSGTLAVFRAGGGSTDTGDNAADFTAGTPTPRNSNSGSLLAPVITSPNTANGTVGQAFTTYQISANNSPTSFNATGLPAGLSVNSSTGLISGTATASGTSTVAISATNSAGTGSASVLITIASAFSPVTVFSENMGSPVGTTSIVSNTFQNSNLVFSGTGDVRSTSNSSGYAAASAGGNIYISNVVDTSFVISGIDTRTYSTLSLSFGHFKSTLAANNELVVEVSADGIAYTGLSYTRSTGNNTAAWLKVAPTGSIPSVANLRIRFRQTSSTSEFRVDDVILTGVALPSAVSVTGMPSAFRTTYGTSSSATSFTVSGQNLTAGILVTPPPGFEVSQMAGGTTGYAAIQTVGGPTTVYLRLAAGTSVGAYAGNFVCTSMNATSASVPVPESNVLPKSLSIAANNRSKPFGAILPLGAGPTGFSSAGLVLGETIGSVTLSATGGKSANDAAGTYLIYPSDATGETFNPSNYDITYSEGQLVVTGVPFSNPAPGADPDGNGLSNLMEYYMGISAESPLIGPPVTVSNSGTTISMTYRRYKGLDGVQGTVEHIGNLTATNWDTNGVTVKQVVDRGTYEEVTVEVALATGEAKMFMRLRVTQP